MRKVLLIPIVLLAFGACDRVVMDPVEPSEAAPAALEGEGLTVDIQPFSEGNVINLGTRSFVTVAIMGSANITVTTVDPSTARFGPAGATPVHVFTTESPTDHIRDIDEDGYTDMLLHFDKAETGLVPVDGLEKVTLTATVSGSTMSGYEWVKLITNGSSK